MQKKYDIGIAGGGMVGASLACALADSDLRIALIEAVPLTTRHQPSYDDRGLALSLSSQRIFQTLGIWRRIEKNVNPIRQVHVSDRGYFGKVRMDAAAMGFDALGYVVMARELGAVLMREVKQIENVDIYCPARVQQVDCQTGKVALSLSTKNTSQELACKLLVIADGSRSEIRKQLHIDVELTDYRQTAIVSNVTAEIAHADTAFERFTEHGPLALLPLKQNRCLVVLTVMTEEAGHYLQLDKDRYLEEIQKRLGRRLGCLSQLSKRWSYPMMQLQAQQQVLNRSVLLGNSAHTIHPNGAQGFNLCLRDVAGLAEQLIKGQRAGIDPGSSAVLDTYLLSRRDDQKRVSRMSHGMTRWFYNKQACRAGLRNAAMTLIDLLPPVKAGLMRRGMGLHGRQPMLVRGLEI